VKAVNTGKLADKVEKLRDSIVVAPVLEVAAQGLQRFRIIYGKELGVKVQRDKNIK
jgi:hypothetical protein